MNEESQFFLRTNGAAFDQTNWWLVGKAGQPELAEADAARASLCETYWYPIYSYIRRQGRAPEEAQDLTQEFFARVLEKNQLQTADRGKGKFRSFLLLMLKRFLADQWDRANRQKRGGGQEVVSMSISAEETEFRYRNEPAHGLSPDKLFERAWALSILEKAEKCLEQESAATGKGTILAQLKPFLLCDSEMTYAAAAEKLQLTESNVKVTVHRFRQRLRELLRAEIAKTALTPEQVEEGIRDLFAAVG